jgi:pimeloyl-ACP methyl ester carboxylesterase
MPNPTATTELETPVDVGGLAADFEGEADGRPPLVLLHGLTFDRRMWRPALDELRAVGDSRHVLSLDLPGHGQSPKRPSYRMIEVVAAVAGAVRAAGFERPVMVGHAHGAAIATAYAAMHPTSGVVNVDASPPIEPAVRMLHGMRHDLRSPLFASIWETMAGDPHSTSLSASARELIATTSRPDQRVVLGYWAEMLDTPSLVLGLVRLAVAAIRRQQVPYLIVTGSEPAAASVRWVEANLPRARFEVLASSGHYPHLGFPERFAQCLQLTGTWSRD